MFSPTSVNIEWHSILTISYLLTSSFHWGITWRKSVLGLSFTVVHSMWLMVAFLYLRSWILGFWTYLTKRFIVLATTYPVSLYPDTRLKDKFCQPGSYMPDTLCKLCCIIHINTLAPRYLRFQMRRARFREDRRPGQRTAAQELGYKIHAAFQLDLSCLVFYYWKQG